MCLYQEGGLLIKPLIAVLGIHTLSTRNVMMQNIWKLYILAIEGDTKSGHQGMMMEGQQKYSDLIQC